MKSDKTILTNDIDNNKCKVISDIIQTSSYINNLHIKYFRPFNISPQQCNILKILRDSEPTPLTMQTIRKRMVDNTPHITRMVDKLEKQLFVQRTPCENDRRITYVRITSAGLEITSKLDRLLDKILDFTNKLSFEESETLSYLLAKLRK